MPTSHAQALDQDAWPNAVWRLGAFWEATGGSITFAVYSKHATRIVLEIYDAPTGADAIAEFAMAKNADDDIWRAKLGGLAPGTLYAFRCWGQNWDFDPTWTRGSAIGFKADFDSQGNRFNPNKVLFDPYARELSHEQYSLEMQAAGEDGGLFGTGGALYKGLPRRQVDTGRWVPKGIVIDDHTSIGTYPELPAECAAIYEAHVRNLTLHPSSSNLRATFRELADFAGVPDIPEALRGTYKAAGMMAPYLKALGFTTLELLPVQETNNGPGAAAAGTFNHWGYMTTAFFAPNRDYAADRSLGGPTREFKEMVKAFHDAGLEVYLDVVFNHSGEGGNWNGDVETTGFVSLGGFDTTEYYVLTDDQHLVDGATGCSNQLNFSASAAQNLVLDSLSYWIDEMGIDGFRFDLAPVLGRTPNAFDRGNWNYQKEFFPQHPLLTAIRDLAIKKDVEVIAEAWDLWGYEVGNFPAGWGEWNGRYRDTLRQFLKGDGNTDDFMSMFNGDYQHFNAAGGPQRSINFITAHDGFTLMDLVSYNQKNNQQARPFGPSDGGNDDNKSWDSGGDRALRRQRLRNFWTTSFFSRGVPLVVAGDEFGRTQNGNNNPWNLNTLGVWNNYAMVASNAPTALPVDPCDPSARYHDNFGPADAGPRVNPLFHFAAFVARLRLENPALKQRAWGDLTFNNDDVSYLFFKPNREGAPTAGDRCLQVHIDASGTGTGDFLVLIDMSAEGLAFNLPAPDTGTEWRRIIDTAAWAEPTCNCWLATEATAISGSYWVHPWSIMVLQEISRT